MSIEYGILLQIDDTFIINRQRTLTTIFITPKHNTIPVIYVL